MVILVAAAIFILLQRLAELRIAAANRAWMLAAGGKEYAKAHYVFFFFLHGAWLTGWLCEGYWRQELSRLWPLWLLLFAMAQGLRYWCIRSLGRFWNTRILRIAGRPPVRSGPYRYLRHPNYLAVAVELVCVPLLFNAWLTAVIISLLNALLLLAVRIPAEEAAWRDIPQS
ncbi:MAG: isoprenylcysteine carboxylmethyltransferase family protein [Sporomusaceae bacterium]|nr:isoprenylcysteine carboxylmethyltransferase family protein [Sporomusaceae bacterium]